MKFLNEMHCPEFVWHELKNEIYFLFSDEQRLIKKKYMKKTLIESRRCIAAKYWTIIKQLCSKSTKGRLKPLVIHNTKLNTSKLNQLHLTKNEIQQNYIRIEKHINLSYSTSTIFICFVKHFTKFSLDKSGWRAWQNNAAKNIEP